MTTNLEYATSACGVRAPKILYGTAWKKERTAGLVEQALALGFRGLDTACQPKHYDEPGVGEGLARRLAQGLQREEVYLQTKFTPVDGQDPGRIPYDPKAGLARQVEQSFEASLKNLRTEYLDCLVLHSPLANLGQTLEVWRALEGIFKSGGIKQIGLSNCYDLALLKQVYEQAEIKPAVLQNRFHAATGYDRQIRAYCQSQGILYQSFWTLTANPEILLHEKMEDLAAKHGRTPAQIFFRYLTQIGIIPLTGTSSETHMREDLAIFEFALAEEECQIIRGLF